MDVTTVGGQPALILGQSDSDFKLRITNTSMDFFDGSEIVAYISNQALYITKVIIKNELQIGEFEGFVAKKRSNGNVGVSWIGGMI